MKAGKYPVVMSNGIGGYHSKYKAKGPGVVTGRSGTIGRLHYIKDDYWPHNTALWVTSFKGNHPKFVYYLYQQLGLERFGSGSGVPTLNRNDVHDAIVPVPHAEEQAQIAACFSQLDHLITLHQREGCPELSQLESGVNWFSLTHVLEYHYGSICTNCLLGKHHQSPLNRI